jgi:hypothetical protein
MEQETMKNAIAFGLLVFAVLVIGASLAARHRQRILLLVAAIAILALSIHFARARDLGQWEATDQNVRDWYQALMQPDNPAVSCCGEADAYWADSFEVDGDKYVAIITDPRPDEPLRRKHVPIGTKIVVPNHKLKYDQSNPTGHGIIFLSRGDYVYCYVAPGGV